MLASYLIHALNKFCYIPSSSKGVGKQTQCLCRGQAAVMRDNCVSDVPNDSLKKIRTLLLPECKHLPNVEIGNFIYKASMHIFR